MTEKISAWRVCLVPAITIAVFAALHILYYTCDRARPIITFFGFVGVMGVAGAGLGLSAPAISGQVFWPKLICSLSAVFLTLALIIAGLCALFWGVVTVFHGHGVSPFM